MFRTKRDLVDAFRNEGEAFELTTERGVELVMTGDWIVSSGKEIFKVTCEDFLHEYECI